MNEYLEAWKKYAVFEGRATRQEYIVFWGVNSAIAMLLPFLHSFGYILFAYPLLASVPAASLAVRRLHDTNRSAWWLLLLLFPPLGWIPLLIFLLQRGQEEGNRFAGGGIMAIGGELGTSAGGIVDFIVASRAAGQTEEQIRGLLMEKGWPEADVAAALAASLGSQELSEEATLRGKAVAMFLWSIAAFLPVLFIVWFWFERIDTPYDWLFVSMLAAFGISALGCLASMVALMQVHRGSYRMARGILGTVQIALLLLLVVACVVSVLLKN
jgi:uncharacterized membrane protein YhaH (DUF805 family)